MGRFDIRTRMTPGHTPGTISFFFEDTDDVTGETFRVGMHGGAGTNQMAPDYLKELGLPEAMAHTFVRDCNEMKELDIDICLPSHLNQINLAANIPEDRTDYRPFVGKEIWKDFLTERAGVVKGFYPEVYGK